MTDPDTPTVPEGWVAVPVAEVEALREADTGMKLLEAARPIVARLPKPPAWTREDVHIVRSAARTERNMAILLEREAEAILAALAAAGRLRDPKAPRDH